MDTQQTLKCFTCERMLPTTSFHVRKTGKRGFCYDCKECRKIKHAQKTETPSQDTTPEPSIPETNSVDCHERRETIPNNIVMIAIENSPTFEHLMQIVDYTKEQLDLDALFKIVATKFPANYMDLFTKLHGAPQATTEQVPPHEPEATSDTEMVSEETPMETPVVHDYKEQFKNDPNMTQVGEDLESDEEYTTMTVRSGNEWRSIRVKRNWN